ncbi:MAG: hypothetical protein DCC55_17955 [Chloroflexi bacterium]|nr:MAG: hypothetical protein DCC55_17955 [Chloroflexota bacterium]
MQTDDEIITVLDASSLIITAKLQAIDDLRQVYGKLCIPPAVYEETVVAGKRSRKLDALVIETAILADKIQVVSLTPPQLQLAQRWYSAGILDLGECKALAYAKETGSRILIEERKGRTVARAEGIIYVVLQVFPLYGYIARRIPFERCMDLLDRIAVAMNSDLAVLNALKLAAEAIRHEREDTNHG